MPLYLVEVVVMQLHSWNLKHWRLNSSHGCCGITQVKLCLQNYPQAITGCSPQISWSQTRSFSNPTSFSWPPFIQLLTSIPGCNCRYDVTHNVNGCPPIPNCLLNFSPHFCNAMLEQTRNTAELKYIHHDALVWRRAGQPHYSYTFDNSYESRPFIGIQNNWQKGHSKQHALQNTLSSGQSDKKSWKHVQCGALVPTGLTYKSWCLQRKK